MDEFAQSREDNDLFADEFEPITEPTNIIEPAIKTSVSQQAPAETTNTSNRPAAGHAKSGRGQGHERRQRGGRGGVGQQSQNGLNQSRHAPQNQTEAPAAPAQDTPSTETPSESALAPAPQRVAAVRGDRSLTGGPLPKKLTEAELTAKMERMAIINAQKSAKHAATEADQAAYQHREAELAKKRAEEQKNSRQMEMERARNRQRKMQAQGGREWDSEKTDADIVDGKGRGRSSEYVRGGFGGVIRGRGAGLASSRFAGEEENADVALPSRGRGGRGRGGGRGGRGGKPTEQSVPTVEDFPSLPTSAKAEEKKVEEKMKSPTSEKPAGDWAEEMATPVEDKKMAV